MRVKSAIFVIIYKWYVAEDFKVYLDASFRVAGVEQSCADIFSACPGKIQPEKIQ